MSLFQTDTACSLRNSHRVSFALCSFAMILITVFSASADYPQWWADRNVLDTTVAVTNDFAAVTQGQLKWITEKARDELNEHGGAGPALEALIASFSTNHNYEAANCGQLKYVASNVYARLIELDYTNDFPWSNSPADDDFTLANAGQVKHLFGFDLDAWDSVTEHLRGRRLRRHPQFR